MFISIEKATELTGRSKNALYRLMAKGHINFVRCTKGKRFLEVAELRRVYGEFNGEPVEPSPVASANYSNNNELMAMMAQMRNELNELGAKVDKQSLMIESLSGITPVAAPTPTLEPVATLPDSPEKDPEWPPFITCYADLAKRDEIKARYEK